MADSVAARDAPLLGGFARQSAELHQFSYVIIAAKSRVFQHFETLSAILFHCNFPQRLTESNKSTM
jgi:hypothetical protein